MEAIKKILVCLEVSKAPGLDGMSSKFLKDGTEVLALALCSLVNLSIKQSLFPGQCDPKNYRPISLLPVVSEIIGKTIQLQTQ